MEAPSRPASAAPRPTAHPFQAPDFGEVDTFPLDEDAQAYPSGTWAGGREAG
ncbi:hypothetical protein ACWC1D_18720 [Streptomyces sp. NPDC001478]